MDHDERVAGGIGRLHLHAALTVLAIVAVAGLALGACASSVGKSTAPMMEQAADEPRNASLDMKRATETREEIEQLWADIEAQRASGGMDTEIPRDAVEAMSSKLVDDARNVCERPDELSGTCEDVCRLSDSICNNAESICRLASDLVGDDWATEKCNGAKAACSDASLRCCRC